MVEAEYSAVCQIPNLNLCFFFEQMKELHYKDLHHKTYLNLNQRCLLAREQGAGSADFDVKVRIFEENLAKRT